MISTSNPLIFNAKASWNSKTIEEIWKKGAVAEARLTMLKDLKSQEKALPQVMKIGKQIQTQKQVQVGKGEVDQKVVELIMNQKIQDAEIQVRKWNRKTYQVKEELKDGGVLSKDVIKMIEGLSQCKDRK